MSETSSSARPAWSRFSLRTLFVVTTVFAVAAATGKMIPDLILPAVVFMAAAAVVAMPALVYFLICNVLGDEVRLQRVAYSAFGLLPLGLGSFLLLLNYIFAKIVNPRLPADERRAVIISRMFLSPGMPMTAVGLALASIGVGILLFGVASLFVRVNPRRFAICSGITICAVLFLPDSCDPLHLWLT